MKCNLWTLTLLGAGVVSLPSVLKAEEKPSSLLTSLPSTTISGYVDTSAQWNVGTGNALTPGYAFGGSGKADGFNLNVVKLSLEKPIDAADSWGAGYKADLLFGPDANALSTQSSGVGTGSDFAVKQAYVALHAPIANGLDFKIGVWDTIIGYEVFESGNNPNFTRSYGYTMEPTTHTGIQVAYTFSEWLSANAGIANTFGSTINGRANPPQAESFKTYMGSFTLTAPTNTGFLAGSTLTGCIISGYNAGLGMNETSFYVGATVATPVTGLKAGVCYDYLGAGSQSAPGTPPAHSPGYANAVGVYSSYQATEKMSLYGRFEYASTDIGVFGPTAAVPVRKVLELTGTLQYDLWKNVLSRLEVRWDHAADGSKPYGNLSTPEVGPTTGDAHNSVIFVANIIYKF